MGGRDEAAEHGVEQEGEEGLLDARRVMRPSQRDVKPDGIRNQQVRAVGTSRNRSRDMVLTYYVSARSMN